MSTDRGTSQTEAVVSKREIAKTWASRTLLTAKAGLSAAKVAGRVAIDKARSVTDLDPTDAEALAARLDDLKGLSLKVGQMASLAQGELHPAVSAALARLQSGATGLAPEAVHGVLREAYGVDHREVFQDFEDTPFAAASIGQVHRARVDGREVAVKIQYPGIDEAIQHDLRNLGSLRFLLVASSFGTRALLQELEERLREECDYRQEAAFQMHFREAFASFPDVVVPEVVVPLVRKTVLVSEFVHAKRFAEFRDTATEEERGRAGVTLFRSAMWAIFAMGMFNGDPHPGNYLFLPDGRVALLDFGCVRVFERSFVATWQAFARCLVEGNEAEFPARANALGIVGSSRYDYEAGWRVFRLIYRPMRESPFQFSNEFSKESFDTLAWKNPNLLRSDIPPHLAFSWRLNWGLFSVLGDLRAKGDFAGAFRDAIYAPLPDPVRPPPLQVG